MDQDSAGRHSAANRKEWRKAGGNTLIQQSQSLHNSLRSWQISTYVGKIVNATGPRIFVGGGGAREDPNIWYSRLEDPCLRLKLPADNHQYGGESNHLLCQLQINWQEADAGKYNRNLFCM